MFRSLFLDECSFSPAEHTRWKISALRIILVSGFVLEALIGIHSSIEAISIGAYHLVAVVVFFYMLLSAGLYHSGRNPDYGAGILIATVYAAGASIVFFVKVDEVAKLGFIFVYTTPMIARLFFGGRLAIALMLLNFVPFFYLLRNAPLTHYAAQDLPLDASHGYIQALLFLFFNICIPLAVFRVLHALDASAIRYRKASSALTASHAQYREFFENAGGPILLCESDGAILQANSRAKQLIGLSDHECIEVSLFGTLHPDTGEALVTMKKPWAEGIEAAQGHPFTARDGRTILVEYVTRTASDRYIVVLRDASGLRTIEEELQRSKDRESFFNDHDALTNLPNRDTLQRHLAEILPSLDGNDVTALVSVRLNSIRHANEKFGTRLGDTLIRRFADELRKALPANAFCAHLRSIVFSIVLPPTRSPNEVVRQVERLCCALPREMEIEEHKLLVQFSTGIALARSHDISPEDLMRRSEVALDSARRSNDDSAAMFDEADAAQIRRAVEVELGILSALKNGEFRLVYQPKVNGSERIAGLEALIRWSSPTLGNVSPAEFIPVAESSNLIHEITRFVINEACAFIRTTINCGQVCPPVAINLSALDIVRDNLLELVDESTARHATPASLLEFEITETGLIGNEALAAHHLVELERRGSRIAIDDFGTGYSSLSKLSTFPVHAIKIDQSFVARIGNCRKSELIIKAIISLADMMACATVAEGVETEVQERFLKSVGCEMFQGYYYHRPLEVSQVNALLCLPAAQTA